MTVAACHAATLINPYPATGPVEVAGAPAASKTLRTVQRYAMPAFTDTLAQHVANVLQGTGEPIRVVRKTRRNGEEAIDTVANAPGDGRTLLLAMNARDLFGVARVAVMPYALVVRKEARFADTADVIAQARQSERLLAGSAGEKSISHAALDMLRTRHKLNVEPVAYKGGYAALQALVTEEVQAALVPLPSLIPYASGGRVRILPSGQGAQLEVSDAFHVFAPAGTPSLVIARINTAIAQSLVTPDAQALFMKLGVRLEHRSAGADAR